jgi:hypothetical protein
LGHLGPILFLVGGGTLGEVEVAKLAGLTWRHVAYMSDSELAVAYSGAAAHVQVSFAEGFGLTVLEAMSVSANDMLYICVSLVAKVSDVCSLWSLSCVGSACIRGLMQSPHNVGITSGHASYTVNAAIRCVYNNSAGAQSWLPTHRQCERLQAYH